MSCISRRSKLDSLLTDDERSQLISIYEALPYEKEQSVLVSNFRDLLQAEILRLHGEGTLIGAIMGDWNDVSRYLNRIIQADQGKEATIDRLSFLHLWKTHGTQKRMPAGLCCIVKRQSMSSTDYDEQTWRSSYIKRLLVAKDSSSA